MPMWRHVVRPVVVVLGCLLMTSSGALAQSAINGVVRDASGGVLPGVTVEAASPALIEKVRLVVPNDQGNTRSSISVLESTPSPSRWQALPRSSAMG